MERAAGADREDLAALLGLAELPGIGAWRLRTLVRAFGGALGAVRAPEAAIARLPGFSPAAATAVRGVSLTRGRAVLDDLDRLGAAVLTLDDPGFPRLLREMRNPPPLLFTWGRPSVLARRAAAVVGSRHHTAYGAETARDLAAGLARAGVVVVSGMARGIDAIAHAAALDAGGTSVGVLGNGFGVVYPAANRALYERMVREGCLISEFPPGMRPDPSAFPRRNRLICGLAMVTVVVEAAAQSGALNTADTALDQGRTVLAVPGPITSLTSVGTNKLIQQGAKPALCVGDVLEELGIPRPDPDEKPAPGTPGRGPGGLTPGHGPGVGSPEPASEPPTDLSALQLCLWEALRVESRHVDALVAAAGGEAAGVLTALTELELRGIVAQRPGMVFALA